MSQTRSQYGDTIGNSAYQTKSKKYYALLREVHTKTFFNLKRIDEEKNAERYTETSVEGIKNLYTFVNILRRLMGTKEAVNGVDFGCGNHFFTADIQKRFGWNVIGYDADQAAVDDAKRRYPDSADKYVCLDVLKDKIPLPDHSQDFEFCNAVIQHFSDEEVYYALDEIRRILKGDGILVLIFKRDIDDWEVFSKETGLQVDVLDKEDAMIRIEDRAINETINKLDEKEKSLLPTESNDSLRGLRILHFFSIAKIIDMGREKGFEILENLEFDKNKIDKAIFKYLSGKFIPTAAIFFKKRNLND